MKSISRRGTKRKRKVMGAVKVVDRSKFDGLEVDTRITLIQELIPLGLLHIAEELKREVTALSGGWHQRKQEEQAGRHGTNPGSVRLAGQRIPIRVPRLRRDGSEVPLESYTRFHEGGGLDEKLFRQVLYGVSCRNYERAAQAVPGAIGISKSSVSRSFIEATQQHLRAFQERDLSTLDVVALLIDGKTFAEDEMVLAVAVTMEGQRVPIGFVQTETENSKALADFLRSLLDRGLDVSCGLLVVIDGAKGIRSAVRQVLAKRALVQRCQWHKRENVLSYLSKADQRRYRSKLQRAYERPTYQEARTELLKIHGELEELNPSAAASLMEGLEETLTLHRLGVFPQLGRSLKTTNGIESINSQVEAVCGKVDRWKNSKQKHRWLAAALLDIEPRLRRMMGHRHLPLLRRALMKELKLLTKEDSALAA